MYVYLRVMFEPSRPSVILDSARGLFSTMRMFLGNSVIGLDPWFMNQKAVRMTSCRRLSCGAIGFTLWASFGWGAAGQVTVKEVAATQETVYSVDDASCHLSWTASHTKLNEHVIQQRSTCTLPLTQQLVLIDKLLTRVLEDKETASKFRSLYLGGLKAYPELRERLAVLAKRSPEWDPIKGRPKVGRLDVFLVKLANQKEFLADWQELFQRHGLRIAVSAVDEPDVSVAGSLSYFKRLQQEGIKANERVPSNCLTGFAIYRPPE
jgi:hypothetical protein